MQCLWNVAALFTFFLIANVSSITKVCATLLDKYPSNPTAPTMSAEDHYALGVQAFEEKAWGAAIWHLRVISHNFTQAPFINEARYKLAVAYFEAHELEFANQTFTEYLKQEGHPSLFEQVFRYKLQIAESFHLGKRKHIFGSKALPRWSSGSEDALAIYEEVHTALPSHELGAQALFAKAKLLVRMVRSEEAIEAYQLFITRFPKHDLTAKAYVAVAKLYLAQCRRQPHDPHAFALSELNVRKFRQQFPADPKLLKAEKLLEETRNVLANALFETGRFYEKTHKVEAAKVYYHHALRTYGGTAAASECQNRLELLAGE